MDWAAFSLVAFTAFLIGVAKAGFAGLTMLNTPVLTWAYTPSFAVGVSLPLLIVGDLVTGWRYFGLWDKRTVLTMLPGAAIGVAIGSPLLAALSESQELFSRAIGVVALVFAVAQLLLERRRADIAEHRPAPAWVGALAGLGTAVVSTIAHQGGLVSNIYLLSQHFTKERFAATAMGIYLGINTMKLVPYLLQGKIDPSTLPYSLAAAPFVVAGVLIGAKYVERMDPRSFARFVLWLVIATGIKLIIWP